MLAANAFFTWRSSGAFDPTLFADESANNLTITRNGTPVRTTNTPFSGSGRSATFNGTTDSLTVANSNTLDTNSSFTLEVWFNYTTTGGGLACIYDRGGGAPSSWSSSNGRAIILFQLSGTLYIQWQITGSNVAQLSVASPAINTWHHLVCGFNGTTMRGWLNGTSIGTSTSLPVVPTTRNLIRVGMQTDASAGYFPGQISNLRFVSADVYGVGNSTITVPTSPLTAIANTQLLLGFNLP
jgi:hypothetical protein